MKFARIITLSIMAMTAVTGCSKKTYTADYLLKDTAKRKEILADCKDNKQSTENCNNANQAQASINAQIQSKAGQIQLIQVEAQQDAHLNTVFGGLNDEGYLQKVKERNAKIAQLKSEMDALAKQ